MKTLYNITFLSCIFLLFSLNLQAQEDEDKNRIIIKTNKGKIDLEEYLEDLGHNLERSIVQFSEDIEDMADDIEIHIDDDSFDAFARRIESSVKKIVEDMEIELVNIKPSEFDDDIIDSNGSRRGNELIEEIEEEYGAKVEEIEKMKININDGKVKLDMKVRLDNGEVIRKVVEDVEKSYD